MFGGNTEEGVTSLSGSAIRTEDTAAYRSQVSGTSRMTVLNVELDVSPVRMAAPLHTPWVPR